ncbi:MAG: hypothetical protein V4649_13230 [Bacteroidota bacterium]
MKQLHILLIALLLLTATGSANAQLVGPVALGLRANPDGGGITAKYFFNERNAIETQVNGSSGNYNDNGTSLTVVALYEHHFILNDPQWRIILGGGMHFGTWNRYGDAHTSPLSVFGLDVIGGVEYVFASVPIGISLDVKPALNFVSGVTTFPNNTFGLGVRYYFGRWAREKVRVVEVVAPEGENVIDIVPPAPEN